ncbi:Crp/Fnr family transcriptional regulator [Kiloniella laminariae]|uniref:Crp/Fnr family transcriptional regulator n=1 Tax=Kiloniella laminariae TaxID=454162 RepID=UPI00036511C4|nr:Crp/Fnr family transcriptional regulator [Kiloniella laminariae]
MPTDGCKTETWRSDAFAALRNSMSCYHPLSDPTWNDLLGLLVPRVVERQDCILHQGDVPCSFGFVYKGLLRFFSADSKGNEYNKVFFAENSYPGSMVALLEKRPSDFTIQALEKTLLLELDFSGYRKLLQRSEDLKWFHILYLEKNWVLAKESREVALVQESATERYLNFRRQQPDLETRLSQYHVASHIGVTPTQLSRIRKALVTG